MPPFYCKTITIKLLFVSLSTRLYPHCLVLVGSRNGFEGHFTIKINWGPYGSQICLLVKYCPNLNLSIDTYRDRNVNSERVTIETEYFEECKASLWTSPPQCSIQHHRYQPPVTEDGSRSKRHYKVVTYRISFDTTHKLARLIVSNLHVENCSLHWFIPLLNMVTLQPLTF